MSLQPGPDADYHELTAPATIVEVADLAFLASAAPGAPVRVNLASVTWVSPLGVVGLLALFHRRLSGISIVLPQLDSVREYFLHSGFLDELQRTIGISISPGLKASRRQQPFRPSLRPIRPN